MINFAIHKNNCAEFTKGVFTSVRNEPFLEIDSLTIIFWEFAEIFETSLLQEHVWAFSGNPVKNTREQNAFFYLFMVGYIKTSDHPYSPRLTPTNSKYTSTHPWKRPPNSTHPKYTSTHPTHPHPPWKKFTHPHTSPPTHNIPNKYLH